MYVYVKMTGKKNGGTIDDRLHDIPMKPGTLVSGVTRKREFHVNFRGERVGNFIKMEPILPAFIDVGEEDQVYFN